MLRRWHGVLGDAEQGKNGFPVWNDLRFLPLAERLQQRDRARDNTVHTPACCHGLEPWRWRNPADECGSLRGTAGPLCSYRGRICPGACDLLPSRSRRRDRLGNRGPRHQDQSLSPRHILRQLHGRNGNRRHGNGRKRHASLKASLPRASCVSRSQCTNHAWLRPARPPSFRHHFCWRSTASIVFRREKCCG